MGRRDLTPLLAVTLIALACAVAYSAGLHSGLLHVAPLLVFVLPLLAGRYVGEDALLALAARRARPPRRRVRAAAAPLLRPPVLVVCGGRLLERALSRRGPPVCA